MQDLMRVQTEVVYDEGNVKAQLLVDHIVMVQQDMEDPMRSIVTLADGEAITVQSPFEGVSATLDAIRDKRAKKVVSVAVSPPAPGGKGVYSGLVVALRGDGSLWALEPWAPKGEVNSEWAQVPDLPGGAT